MFSDQSKGIFFFGWSILYQFTQTNSIHENKSFLYRIFAVISVLY